MCIHDDLAVAFGENTMLLQQVSQTTETLHLLSTGLGFALSYTPAIAMVGKYFSERKALAYGIALSGSDIFTSLLFSSFSPTLSHLTFHSSFRLFHLYVFIVFLCAFFTLFFKFLIPSFLHSFHVSSLGSGIGTFLLAPAVQLLIEFYSWRGALLILGAFVSNLCVCGALMRPLEPRAGQR